MKKLKTTLRITDLDTVSDTIVRLYKADSVVAADEHLKGVMAEMEDLSARITTAIKADRTYSTLDAANARRDEIIRSLGTLLNGYAVIPVAEKKAAAERLLATFDKYKGITGESYADESSLVESMLEDFADGALADAIATLEGVSVYLADLRAAQDAFNAVATASKDESATAVKKPLLSVINEKLVPYLTAMSLAGKDEYGDFIAKADAEIEKMNAAVAKRVKSGGNAAE